MKKKTKFHKALDIVRNDIKEDPELYYTYQSNIAMAFYDEYYRLDIRKYKNKATIHEITNNAAKNFLNLWIKD
jgi:hypothetical protein